MSTPLLPKEQRMRFALSTQNLLGMPELYAAVEAEVEQTLEDHPELPRTEKTRRVLWGLALPRLSQAATEAVAAADANQKPETKPAA